MSGFNPAFSCQTNGHSTVLSSHHSSAQNPMQVPLCISVRFLAGFPIPAAHMQASVCPPATCNTDLSAGFCSLHLAFVHISPLCGKETLSLSILSDPTIFALGFYSQLFYFGILLDLKNWKNSTLNP